MRRSVRAAVLAHGIANLLGTLKIETERAIEVTGGFHGAVRNEQQPWSTVLDRLALESESR